MRPAWRCCTVECGRGTRGETGPIMYRPSIINRHTDSDSESDDLISGCKGTDSDRRLVSVGVMCSVWYYCKDFRLNHFKEQRVANVFRFSIYRKIWNLCANIIYYLCDMISSHGVWLIRDLNTLISIFCWITTRTSIL